MEHPKKSKFQSSWKWVPPFIIFTTLACILAKVPQFGSKFAEMPKVHSEARVLDSALVLATVNPQVGALLRILSIIEGSHKYIQDDGRL